MHVPNYLGLVGNLNADYSLAGYSTKTARRTRNPLRPIDGRVKKPIKSSPATSKTGY